ncbi:Prolyl endopeptidase [Lamellibrachia satsuma]|nr:Prolyl endopeptidase [Lamellibrachia satsuma]
MQCTKFKYPRARRDDDVCDDYHGTKIYDPYRWLEDPDAEETKAFVEEQNKLTVPYLQDCEIRDKLQDRITELWDYPKYSCPKKRGSRYYYYHNTGLQNQSVLYMQDTLDAEPTVFLDPNKLSEDGTTSIRGTAFSEDGAFFAFGLSFSGSDWVTIKFKETATGNDLPDVLERVKFSSMAWTHDNKGFFYNRYPEEDGKADGTETTCNLNQKLYFHQMATPPSKDILCAEWLDNPKWTTGIEVSDCGRYLVVTLHEGCEHVNRLYYVDLSTLTNGITGLLPFVKVVDNFDAEYEYITNEGSLFTFKTNLKTPHYKLINIDFNKPQMENWTTLVDEDSHNVLEWAACVHSDKLVLSYLDDVKSTLHLHELTTGQRVMTFPLDIGSVVGYSGKKKDTEIFYQFMSFLTPGIIYRCDLTEEKLHPKVFREIKVKNFDASNFVTEQVFYESKDNTKIPMFTVHKKDLPLDGSHPVLLYGYGGFNISITPTFSTSRIVFMDNLCGVIAVPNIRGGGEYGEMWHKGGMLAAKQNCFDDFQTAAEFLVQKKYTSPKRIAIMGGSNGGLLVAACVNQRPDLFGCAVAQVGVMDMLRFHKFTIGHAWTTDYGCSEIPDEFNWLIKYSPLHNIQPPAETKMQYPAVLLLTGDHDDRVVPLHSLKFIAQLQHLVGNCDKQRNPLLTRIDTKSGHGAGKPTAKIIEEYTDIYCFIAKNLDLQWHN